MGYGTLGIVTETRSASIIAALIHCTIIPVSVQSTLSCSLTYRVSDVEGELAHKCATLFMMIPSHTPQRTHQPSSEQPHTTGESGCKRPLFDHLCDALRKLLTDPRSDYFCRLSSWRLLSFKIRRFHAPSHSCSPSRIIPHLNHETHRPTSTKDVELKH